jgi:hypothetical protein
MRRKHYARAEAGIEDIGFSSGHRLLESPAANYVGIGMLAAATSGCECAVQRSTELRILRSCFVTL